MYRVLLPIILLVSICLGGCATIVKGNDQPVSVNTPGAEGALCDLTSPSIGTFTVKTPGNLNLPKSRKDIAVVCRKECYNEATGIIPSSVAGMTLGNVILGGGIGFVVDAASGAMHKYQSSITVPMTKIPGCRPKRTDFGPWFVALA